MIDTGAVASVAPPSFASHIILEELDSTSSMRLQTATAEPMHLYGFKDVYLHIGTVDLCVRLYISDVHQPMLGLNDIMTSGVTLQICEQLSSMILKHGKEELLQYLHRHLWWAEAVVLLIDRNINAAWILYGQSKRFTDSNGLCLNNIEQPEDITADMEHASRKASSLPSEEIAQHSTYTSTLSKLVPHLSACSRSTGTSSSQISSQEQPTSIIQMDYAYVNHPEATSAQQF